MKELKDVNYRRYCRRTDGVESGEGIESVVESSGPVGGEIAPVESGEGIESELDAPPVWSEQLEQWNPVKELKA